MYVESMHVQHFLHTCFCAYSCKTNISLVQQINRSIPSVSHPLLLMKWHLSSASGPGSCVCCLKRWQPTACKCRFSKNLWFCRHRACTQKCGLCQSIVVPPRSSTVNRHYDGSWVHDWANSALSSRLLRVVCVLCTVHQRGCVGVLLPVMAPEYVVCCTSYRLFLLNERAKPPNQGPNRDMPEERESLLHHLECAWLRNIWFQQHW